MKIIIHKKQGKASILTIIRDDGTSTWSKLYVGMETHDLCHYAVESVLEFKNAFFGIINKGFEIGDFELPKDTRPFEVQPVNLHSEALTTEHLVNLLEVELLNSGTNKDFLTQLEGILKENNLKKPSNIDENSLAKIRQCYHDLVAMWQQLTPENTIELDLSI